MFSAKCSLPAGRLSNREVHSLTALRMEEAARFGKCAETFTDPAAFQAHMKAVHGRTPYSPEVLKPYAHGAPKAPSEAKSAVALAGIAAQLLAGRYDVRMHWSSEATLPAGEAVA